MAGRNRAVRVVTICHERMPGDNESEIFDYTLERMDFASVRGPDIVCTPECFLSEPDPVGGPITERLGKWAKAHNCYVIGSIYTLRDGLKYNSAVLIGRDGAYIGQYDKINITEHGMKAGSIPGNEDPPVFETDFGTIGMQICFDVNWRHNWATLKQKGAELVFWPSAYPATRQIQALAWQNQYYVATSTRQHPSIIYDISGDVLDRSGVRTPWTDAVVHLDKRLFEIDYQITNAREIEKKYGNRVKIVWQHDEDWFTVASLDPELSVSDLITEFELTPLAEYHVRAAQANQDCRKSLSEKVG